MGCIFYFNIFVSRQRIFAYQLSVHKNTDKTENIPFFNRGINYFFG